MKRLLAVLLAAMFLALPVALAEELTNETIVDSTAQESVEEGATTEETNLIATNEISETNLSETESEAIAETIESSETEATEAVSVTPDMPLRWGLKTWTEKLDLLLTFNKFKKAEKKLDHARERLQEMKQMAAKKNLKALAKAQKAHAELVAEVAEGQEDLANEDLTAAEKVELVLQKHIQVLEQVQAKLTAKGVPTQGVENALVKSRNAWDKFQSMNETRKAKLSEKVKERRENREEEQEEGSEENSEISVDTIEPNTDCGANGCGNESSEQEENKTE